jgi:hypothetical protein
MRELLNPKVTGCLGRSGTGDRRTRVESPATGAPRRQVAGSAHNNFWRLPDRSRSPRGANSPELLARPRGCPFRSLTLVRRPVDEGIHRTTERRRPCLSDSRPDGSSDFTEQGSPPPAPSPQPAPTISLQLANPPNHLQPIPPEPTRPIHPINPTLIPSHVWHSGD